MTPFYYVLAFLVIQRLSELVIANRNTRRLLAEGATEHGRNHYFLFVVLHTAWLVGMILLVPQDAPFNVPLLLVFVLLQLGRVWVLMTLGKYWTTRIITLPEAPLLKSGPFRFVRHPNYLVVVGEIAVVPLIAGMWELAVVFSVLNAILISYRIRIEDDVLGSRR